MKRRLIDQVTTISKRCHTAQEARDSFVMTVLFVHKSFSVIEIDNCLEYIKGQLYELEKPNIAAQQMKLFDAPKKKDNSIYIDRQKVIYKELYTYISTNKQTLTRID